MTDGMKTEELGAMADALAGELARRGACWDEDARAACRGMPARCAPCWKRWAEREALRRRLEGLKCGTDRTEDGHGRQG